MSQPLNVNLWCFCLLAIFHSFLFARFGNSMIRLDTRLEMKAFALYVCSIYAGLLALYLLLVCLLYVMRLCYIILAVNANVNANAMKV